MKIKWMLGMGAGAAALLAAGEYALARYFLRRTLMRGKADNKRTGASICPLWRKTASGF